jgi:asparagine synthase (glutamine-hydrolysing)
MCGVAGVVRREPRGVQAAMLERMAAAIRHRGPDGFGISADARVGLAHVRLSILDHRGGAQPMANENGSVRVVFNGEIFNYLDLRERLTGLGHAFRTRSDTEVLIHGWEQWGEEMLPLLNGQFAFAIADTRPRDAGPTVFLARDRFGILPLYYAERDGDLYFGSEVKALLASGEVDARMDPVGLDQVFTFWAARPPRTPFDAVRALEPGCCARWERGRLALRRWYALEFPAATEETPQATDVLDALLRSAVAHRLLADVPVGAYLSGGLDSSAVCALAADAKAEPLRTFSVTFDDPRYDEAAAQRTVAGMVASRHATQAIGDGDIARVFPAVVRHAETPLLRTAAAPLYLLSRLAREHGITVVLSGEGADEVFFGYDLFTETAVRLFCLRQPQSRARPRLFDRLYAYLAPASGSRGGEFWRTAFLAAGAADDPLFSHLPRFRLSSWIRDFYSPGFREQLRGVDALEQLRAELPPAFPGWSPLARAAYLEIVTLMTPYLLAAQGDRMAMAHGVELRVPYLDHRVVEFAGALPDRSKLRSLRGKAILRRWAEGAGVLPPAVARRPKQPYRAPDVPAFFGSRPPEYVAELLEPASLARTGVFDPQAVAGLVRRCRTGGGLAVGVRESQALVGVLSTELWHREFLSAPAWRPAALPTIAA